MIGTRYINNKMLGDFNDNESGAILSWMDTFSFNEDFRDQTTGELTVESISDGLPILLILQDA